MMMNKKCIYIYKKELCIRFFVSMTVFIASSSSILFRIFAYYKLYTYNYSFSFHRYLAVAIYHTGLVIRIVLLSQCAF